MRIAVLKGEGRQDKPGNDKHSKGEPTKDNQGKDNQDKGEDK
jgi:hypothetical protein